MSWGDTWEYQKKPLACPVLLPIKGDSTARVSKIWPMTRSSPWSPIIWPSVLPIGCICVSEDWALTLLVVCPGCVPHATCTNSTLWMCHMGWFGRHCTWQMGLGQVQGVHCMWCRAGASPGYMFPGACGAHGDCGQTISTHWIWCMGPDLGNGLALHHTSGNVWGHFRKVTVIPDKFDALLEKVLSH